MDSINHQDKEMIQQYFEDSKELCDNIKESVTQFHKCESDILGNREILRRKRRTYVGSKFFLMILIVGIAWIPILLITSLFTSFPLWPFAIITTIASGYYVRWRYIKDVLPIYEQIYGTYIMTEQDYMEEIMSDLFVNRDMYEETLHLIPVDMRHKIAMNLMNDSVSYDISNTLGDAIHFYQDRYKKIKQNPAKAAQILNEEIMASEDEANDNINIMLNLEEIADAYL